MASGDTKTEAMLNVLGNGGTGDEFRGCCNTKTQSYILDAIDRINAIQPGGSSDFNDLENRPQLNGVAMTGNTNITNFTGTDGTNAGAQGLVPAPAAADADKFLKSDGTWATAGGGGGPTVVQTAGNSQTDVMSQSAATHLVYANPGAASLSDIRIGNSVTSVGDSAIVIGWNAQSKGRNAVAVGASSRANNTGAVAIGYNARNDKSSSVCIGTSSEVTSNEGTAVGGTAKAQGGAATALGAYSTASNIGAISFAYCNDGGAQGVVNFGPYNSSYGYNNTNYRLLTGVHDAQNAHDAVTLGQITQLLSVLNSALGTSLTITNGVITNGNNANNNSDESGTPDDVDPSDPSDPSAPDDPGGEPAPEDAEAPGP